MQAQAFLERHKPRLVEIANAASPELQGNADIRQLLTLVHADFETVVDKPGKRFGSRADVIERYRQDLWQRIRSGEMPLEELAALANRELACWCLPRPCHAEVLARAAIWAAERLGETGRSRP